LSIVSLQTAVQILNADGVVAIPTETVYGLGAKISSEEGLKKIFSVKQRPFFDPLIVHVNSIDQAKMCFNEWPDLADQLAQKFWPGPLTLIMNKSALVSDVITAGLPRVGVRLPNHPVALQLIELINEPIAAPSANKFGKTSPTCVEHVIGEFADDVAVLQSGPSEIGIESTVLLIDQGQRLSILRKGFITKESIDLFLGISKIKYLWVDQVEKSLAPGLMKHHYMPPIPLVVIKPGSLIERESQILEFIDQNLSQLPDQIDGVKIEKPRNITRIRQLVLPENPIESARLLYSELRLKSLSPAQALYFKQEARHSGEMWESIFDRLYKAASLIID
jgi:L-threonylcarbamoyladenylate synthase